MPRSAVSICYNKNLRKLGRLENLRCLIDYSANTYGDGTAFTEIDKKNRAELINHSYSELRADIQAFGTALIDIGLKDCHINIIGENSYRWIVSYFSVINGTGVVCPLDKELTDEDIGKLSAKSDAQAIILSKSFKSKNALSLWKAANPALRYFIFMDCEPDVDMPDGVTAYSMDALKERGSKLLLSGDKRFTEAEIVNDTVAAILFTSGTTGANKGVMLSHKNITSNIDNVVHSVDSASPSMMLLPLNHAFELNCHTMPCILSGNPIFINDSLKHLMSNLQIAKPGMTVVVPLFLDMVYKNIWDEAKKTGNDKTLKKAIAFSDSLRKVGVDIREQMFKRIKLVFGGNLKYIICGGAPVNAEVIRSLNSIGIDIDNGYGITECSPIIAINSRTNDEPYSVGIPFDSIDVRINDKDSNGIGEICVKGDIVMLGYYKDEAATKVSFDSDGYFRTGDYGMIDKKGRLHVTGRKKNLIILENGKNVHPEELEAIIQEQIPYVREVVVYETSFVDNGKKRKAIEATMYLDSNSDNADASRDDVEKLLTEELRKVNKKLPSYKNIYYLQVADEEFEKTNTKKIKRQSVVDKYINQDRLKV